MDCYSEIKPKIVTENPFLKQQNKCRSLEMFLKGVKESKVDIMDGFFAWHGTSN